jgi:hypothetical protein
MARTADGDPDDRRDDTSPIHPVQRSSAYRAEDGGRAAQQLVVRERGERGWHAPPLHHQSLPDWIYKYLADGEHVRAFIQPHIAMIIGPLLLTLVVAIFAFALSPANGVWDLRDLVWVLFWYLFVRLAWYAFFWWRDRIVITGQRIFRVSGIFIREADSMPLSKVTDLKFRRTPMGYLLGYGTFVVESAGQDQALSTIDYVPQPDTVYNIINTHVFMDRD